MAIDREETLRKAEKLLRQGRLDAAIAEYARVAETHPGDLATVNKLGELYQRAGQTANAITCYGRVADHWLLEGLHAKATSHYKKILKLNPEDETAMLQIVESTAQQGLLPEAKTYLRAALDRRLARGDDRGADELRLKLADLDPNDFEAWLAGLRIRVRDTPEADLAPVLRDAIAKLDAKGRSDEGDELTLSVIELDPDDTQARVRASRAAMRRGDFASARAVLQDPATSESYDVALIAAELALAENEEAISRRNWFERLLVLDRARAAADLVAFGDRLVADDVDASYACVEVLADHHAVASEFREATDLVQRFLGAAPKHLPALLRLVELCVDGDFESELTDAQGRLADVYIETGQFVQARVIGEDLLTRDPKSAVQRDRLHRALVAQGEEDPDSIITELLGFAEESMQDLLPTSAPLTPKIPLVDEPEFAAGVGSMPIASLAPEASADDVIDSPWVEDTPAFQAADLGVFAPPEPVAPVAPVTSVAPPEPEPVPEPLPEPPPQAAEPQRPSSSSKTGVPKASPPSERAQAREAASPASKPEPPVSPAPERAREREPEPEAPAAVAIHQAGPAVTAASDAEAAPKGKTARQRKGSAAHAASNAAPAPAPAVATPVSSSADTDADAPAAAKPAAARPAKPQTVAKPAPPPAVPAIDLDAFDLSGEIDLTAALDALSREEDDANPAAWRDDADDDDAVAPAAAPTANGSEHVQEPEAEPHADDVDVDVEATGEAGVDADVAAAGDDDDLEAVFEGLREQAADQLAELPQTDQSMRLLAMADTYQAAGMIDEAQAALEQAAGDPRYRFKAAVALGRLFWREGNRSAALGWYGTASEASAPTPDDSRAVLYELAEKLEEHGDRTQALAVLLELVAEQDDYRDARARIDRLVRMQQAEP